MEADILGRVELTLCIPDCCGLARADIASDNGDSSYRKGIVETVFDGRELRGFHYLFQRQIVGEWVLLKAEEGAISIHGISPLE
jgi:hypothetical protein